MSGLEAGWGRRRPSGPSYERERKRKRRKRKTEWAGPVVIWLKPIYRVLFYFYFSF